MGRGGESLSIAALQKKNLGISSLAGDLSVLKSLWLSKASGDDHAERLEAFYGSTARHCAHRRDRHCCGLRFFMPNPDPESGHLPRRIMTTQPKLCGAGASQLA